jgi:hypothetical protein
MHGSRITEHRQPTSSRQRASPVSPAAASRSAATKPARPTGTVREDGRPNRRRVVHRDHRHRGRQHRHRQPRDDGDAEPGGDQTELGRPVTGNERHVPLPRPRAEQGRPVFAAPAIHRSVRETSGGTAGPSASRRPAATAPSSGSSSRCTIPAPSGTGPVATAASSRPRDCGRQPALNPSRKRHPNLRLAFGEHSRRACEPSAPIAWRTHRHAVGPARETPHQQVPGEPREGRCARRRHAGPRPTRRLEGAHLPARTAPIPPLVPSSQSAGPLRPGATELASENGPRRIAPRIIRGAG